MHPVQPCTSHRPHIKPRLSWLVGRLPLCTHTTPQLKAAEVLRDEARAERERLAAREATLAASEASLEQNRRELERQAAEVSAAVQVNSSCTRLLQLHLRAEHLCVQVATLTLTYCLGWLAPVVKETNQIFLSLNSASLVNATGTNHLDL